MKQVIIIFSAICIMFISFAFDNPKSRIFGVIKAIKIMNYNDTNLIVAGFSSLATLYENPAHFAIRPYGAVKDGTLKLKGKQLGYNTIIRMYIDTVNRTIIDTISWQLIGSNQHENFNYTTVKAIPNFTNIAAIPKVISKSKNYVINFGTLQGVDKIEFNINNNQLYLNAPFYKKIPASANSITINKADLSNLVNANQTTVNITLIAEEEKVYNNKTYIFENRLEIVKYVTVTN